MASLYQAPVLEPYGTVTALTASVKCSLGADNFSTDVIRPGVEDTDMDIFGPGDLIKNSDCIKTG